MTVKSETQTRNKMGFLEYDKDEDGYYVSLTLLSQGGDLRLMRDVIIPAELNVDAASDDEEVVAILVGSGL